ncbi:MAG: hypothetical protein IJ737_02850 [Ruminococcus sp.]|nr:hypothetical protein [Ruminococcus sp.]
MNKLVDRLRRENPDIKLSKPPVVGNFRVNSKTYDAAAAFTIFMILALIVYFWIYFHNKYGA